MIAFGIHVTLRYLARHVKVIFTIEVTYFVEYSKICMV